MLERLVHSGDLSLGGLLQFTPGPASRAWRPCAGAVILTDTAMAAAAVAPMAQRTLGSPVELFWSGRRRQAPEGSTRSAVGLERAWSDFSRVEPAPVVLIGGAPTALERLLELVSCGVRRRVW